MNSDSSQSLAVIFRFGEKYDGIRITINDLGYLQNFPELRQVAAVRFGSDPDRTLELFIGPNDAYGEGEINPLR